MNRIMKYAPVLVAAVLAAGAVSCEQDETDKESGEMIFALLDGESGVISGTQTFIFGAERTYDLTAERIVSVHTTRPDGWAVATNLRDKQCRITAPMAVNEHAASSGSITFHLTGPGGVTKEYAIPVSAGEIDLDFDFDAPAHTVSFAYNQMRTYTFTASASLGDIVFSVPNGWKADYTAGESEFSITAPQESDEKELSGTVSVTPVSQRGEKGASVRFDVKVESVKMPVLTLASYDDQRFKFGVATPIAFTATDVARVEVDKPGGWTVDVDLEGKRITVTAPADLDAETAEYGGAITLKSYNSLLNEEYTDSDRIMVRLDGIADMKEMEAFAADYKRLIASEIAEIDLDRYMQSGEIVLLDDVGPIESANYITGTGGNADDAHKIFSHTLNGLRHKITLNVDTNLYIFGSLFQGMAAPAVLKNIAIDGQLRITTGTESGAWGVFGGITAKSWGAKFEHVTTEFTCIYEPIALLTAVNNHYYGGFVGWARYSDKAFLQDRGPTKMTDCHSKGALDISSGKGAPMYFANLIAYTNSSGTELTNCSNSGNIVIKAPETGGKWKNPARIGGLVGHTVENAGSGITLTNCTNTGDIELDARGRSDIDAYIGGLAGTLCGAMKACENSGNISSTSLSGNSRYGGLVGHANTNHADGGILIENCVNGPHATDAAKKGTVCGTGNFIGGIAGCAYGNQSVVIKGSTNKGLVWSNVPVDANYLGGICGYFSGKELSDCINEGEVKGGVKGAAAGLVARADTGKGAGKGNPTVVRNCSNKGALNITTALMGKSRYGWLPLTAGLVSVGPATEGDKDHYYSFTNCTNTGAIHAEVTKNGCTRNVWILVRKHRADDSSSVDETVWITADEPTAAAQADRSRITEVLNR